MATKAIVIRLCVDVEELYSTRTVSDMCWKCGGDGYVTCEYGHEHVCPDCNGTGRMTAEEQAEEELKEQQFYVENMFYSRYGTSRPESIRDWWTSGVEQ